MRKKEGSLIVESTVFFLIIVLMIFLFFLTCAQQAKVEREMTSDDIVSSELAAFKDIDAVKLGEDPDLNLLVITKPQDAFDTFKKHLKINLNVDDNFEPTSEANFIKSKVEIQEFNIYNVYDDHIEILKLNSTGGFDSTTVLNSAGPVIAPTEKKIETTAIYAKVSFELETIFGNKQKISTSEVVDIGKTP